MTPYMYIVVRKDMSPEMQMVQACHAASEAAFQTDAPELPTHIVLLQCENKRELSEVALRLTHIGIEFKTFFEPDNDLEYTALATLPTTKRNVRAFKKLKLWKQ